jgi:hypothetical protein
VFPLLMIHLSDSLKHYKRADVQAELIEHSLNKEIAARFNERFGKRPDILMYENDVMELAKKGATSFHCSEELWNNPLHLRPLMSRKELDELRSGWDLVLDVDCQDLEYSKIASDLIIKELQRQGITSLSAKFSGNHGFHIAIPFESFPNEVNSIATKLLFPEAAKRIAMYVKQNITLPLAREILQLEGNSFNNVATKTKINVGELYIKDSSGNPSKDEQGKAILNVEPFLAIDTVLLSSRHMYRMPYSMHEKSGLVSIPVDINNIRKFDKATASPKKIVISLDKFLDRSKAKPSEAVNLFAKAYDATFIEPKIEREEKEYEIPAEAIPETFFPPCIQKLLLGVKDGRKRALFVLLNFFSSCGWGHEAIEARLQEWNKKNPEPLHQTYFIGQVRYHKQHRKKMLPPNCHNPAYYKDLLVKCSEEICSKVKNPVGFARRKSNK